MDEWTTKPMLEVGPNAERADTAVTCMSCGGPHARRWSTPQGTAHLCPTCATLHGLGCP